MPKVLDYFRQREPNFNDVSDDKLTKYIGEKHPEFLQDKEFAQYHYDTVNPPSMRMTPGFAAPQYERARPAVDIATSEAAMNVNADRRDAEAATKREEELQQTLQYHPLFQATKTLGRAGKVTLAATADAAALATGQPAENLSSYANRPDAPTPVEEGLDEMTILGNGFWGGAAAIGAKSSAALLRTAPALGLGAGLGALGAPAAQANALALGASQEQGGFDPVGAAIAGGLPGVTRAGEQGVAKLLEKLPTARVVVEVLSKDPLKLKGKVVQRLGGYEISNDVFRKYLEAGGGLLAANAYLTAMTVPQIMELPANERHEAALEAVAVNLATSLSGFTSRKGTSLTLEGMMPKLRAEWMKANAPQGPRFGRTQPAEEGAPVSQNGLPAAYDPFSPTPKTEVTPNSAGAAMPPPIIQAPPATGSGNTPFVPETPATVQAQAGLAANPQSPKSTVLVTPGEVTPQVPGLVPVPTTQGTALVNPQKADPQTVADELNAGNGGEALGMSSPAKPAGGDVVVQTTAPDGTVIQDEVATPATVPAAKAAGEALTPGATTTIKTPEQVIEQRLPSLGNTLADTVGQALRGGGTMTPAQVREFGASLGLDDRQSGEWAELGATEVAREIAQHPDMTDREKFHALVSLYDRMPTNGSRTVETKVNQQYSTPPPLAWIGAVLADFKNGLKFGEPTAGHGMLMIGANPKAQFFVNELDTNRSERLQRFFGKNTFPAKMDATTPEIFHWLKDAPVDRTGQNPPFGSVLNAEGTGNKEFPIINAATKAKTTPSIDLAIALNTFEAMTPQGKGFAIIGSKTGTPWGGTFGTDKQRSEDYRRPVMMEFFERFNVVDWFTLGGDLYRKMGAAWPVDMIIVHGKGKTRSAKDGGVERPWVKPPRVIETWEQLAALIPEGTNENIKSGTSTGETGERTGGTRPSAPEPVGERPGKPPLPVERPERPPANGRPGGGTATPTSQVPNPTPEPPARVPGDSSTGIGTGTPATAGGVAQGGAKPGQPGTPAVGGARPVAAGSGKVESKQPELAKWLDDSYELTPTERAEALEKLPAFFVKIRRAIAELKEISNARADRIAEKPDQRQDAEAFRDWREQQTKLGNEESDQIKAIEARFKGEAYFHVEQSNSTKDSESLYVDAEAPVIDDTLLSKFRISRHGATDVLPDVIKNAVESAASRTIEGDSLKSASPNQIQTESQMVNSGASKSPTTKAVKPSVPVEGLPASLMVKYQGVSKGPSLNLVAPRNIANQMLAAQTALEAEVGMPIDNYVADRLGRDVKTLHTQLSGAQIDAAALAIRNIERGSALITADETGVGKGRVVAAILEYARMRNLVPIFVTAKKNLYADMVGRDMPALGNKDYKPFITDSQFFYEDGHGREVKGKGTASAKVEEMQGVIRTGNLPGGAHAVFTTYDQLKADRPTGFSETPKQKFQRVNAKRERPDGPKWQMIRALAPRAIFILDEAHMAAGPTSELNMKFTSILPTAKGNYYSSATFAKRPDNLGLYALGTLMKRTGLNNEQMTEALTKGGVPLQQALTSMLAESGELVRRQQDWTGVEMGFKMTAKDAASDIEAADTYTSFIRDLMSLAEQVNAVGKGLENGENQVRADEESVKVSEVTFGSRLFNLSNQYLLALRSPAIVREAIAELKAGRKPFIALYNTMEGPILDLRARKLPLSFSGILRREMAKMLKLTVRDPMAEGGKKEVELQPEDLPDGGKFYRELERQIEATDFSRFPISPIDYIKNGLKAAGYSVGELTARDGEVDDSGGEITISKRDKQERNKILGNYNNGQTDVIIVNGSGSTGLSAHTDPRFKDQRQRVMIVGQPAPDINEFMQMLGRVMRSGQTSKPVYRILNTALAAERRFATMLRGKMTSLNANTTAEGESGMTQSEGFAEDIFNVVGDDVVFRVMQANQDLSNLLDLGTGADDKDGFENFARYATGRFVLLPNADAQRLWDEIIAEYRDEIQQLDEAGENPLRATAEDLRARTIEKQDIVAASGNTVFDGAASLEKAIVKPPKAPPRHAEALQRAKDNLPTVKQRVREWLDKSKAAEAERIAAASQRGQTFEQIERIKQTFSNVRYALVEASRKIGDTFGYDAMGDGTSAFYGVAAEMKLADKSVSDFASLSRQQLVLATNTFRGRLTLPLSKLYKDGNEQPLLNLLDEDEAAGQFDKTAESNAERYIITGNLLRGWEAADSATNGREVGRPRVTIYTREDGTLNTGILMPPAWTPGETGGAQHIIQDESDFVSALVNETPLRSLPTSSVHPVQVVAGRLAVPSSGQGKVLWGDPEFQQFFEQSPMQLQGNFVGVVKPQMGKWLFQFLTSKGVRLIVKPSETANMQSGGGGGAAARGAFVSGASTAPGTVPPTVTFGGMQFVRPLQLPELVRLTRELSGAVPGLRKFPTRGGKQTLGQFGDGMITLDPRIFKDPETAAKVLAHELGHLTSYLPHETLKRGNLLGHLLALKGYLKSTFGMLQNKELRAELMAVTMWWRPYDIANDPKSYVSYRGSAEELYADALSVLFNAPSELETRAPKFYEAFWKHLGNRPEVESALFGIQDLLNKGMLPTAKEREVKLESSFGEGESRWKAAVADRERAAQSWDGWWTRLWQELYWNFYPLEERAAKVEKAGAKLAPEKDPRKFLDDFGYRDVTVMAWGRHIHEKVIQPLENAGLTLTDAGKFLFYTRVMAGDRSGLANPGGITPQAAQLGLLKMNLELGLGKMTLLRDAVRIFHDDVFKLAEQAVEVGAYNKTTFEQVIKPNKGSYATFAVLDYLDDYIPAGIKEQMGTFKDIANPFHATILKSIGLINLIAYQQAKNKTMEFSATFYPDDFVPAKTAHEPPPRKGFGTFMRLENGRPTWYYTDPYIADAFTKMNPRNLWWLARAADGVFRRVVYPMIITYNPGFLYFLSPLRDVQRTTRNLPHGSAAYLGGQLGRIGLAAGPMAIGGALGGAVLGVPGAVLGGFVGGNVGNFVLRKTSKLAAEVWDRYSGKSGPLIREMESVGALGTPFDQLARNNRDDFMADLLKRMRVMPDHELQGWYQSAIFTPIRSLLNGLEQGGLTLDTVAKAAAYQKLKKRGGMNARQMGYWVRNNAGLPNINKKGLLVKYIRILKPFWNVAMQGWRSDLKNMSHPTTRSGWWLRYMMMNGFMRALLAVAATGALGAALKELFDGMSEYTKTNKMAIPVGQMDGGEFGRKTVSVEFPEDETAKLLGGLISKSIRALGPDDVKLTGMFDLGMSQFPGNNPALTVPDAWQQYLRGQNPEDSFRGGDIVPDREFKVRGKTWDSFQTMSRWTLNQSGAPNFVRWDPRSETTWELSLSAIPGVNKFIKVSDQGYREQQRAQDSEMDAAQAMEKLKLPDQVQSINLEYWRLNKTRAELRTPEQSKRYDDLKYWYGQTYRPAWEAIQTATEEGFEARAAQLRRQLDTDSKLYYRPSR